MKYLLVFLLTFTSFVVSAQRVINLDSAFKAPKTEAQLIEGATKTLDVAIYKDNKYPIYVTKNSKYFIVVKAATSGNWYRKYIKKED